jgi:outer membrane protein assembly factor BamB
MRKKLLLGVAALVLVVAGVAAAFALRLNDRPEDSIDTELKGISVSTAADTDTSETLETTTTTEDPPSKPEPDPERCWKEFGGNPQRTLSLDVNLGRPKKALWSRGVKGLMEYPPSFCDGKLYVNTQSTGRTTAYDARTGELLWTRTGGPKASTPAIAGPRLVVTSQDGTVLGLNRENGRTLWKIETSARVESSPVVLNNVAYFGATDGRLFAVNVPTGSIRWAYNTGGRINASPSVWGNRICITTYAGSIFCLRRSDGAKLWSTYVKRGVVGYESFYSSPSTDGKRLYTAARSGKLVALDATSGRIVWTASLGGLTYPTPALADGKLYLGTRSGNFNSYDAATGRLRWSRYVGPVAGSALVVGDLVFVSSVTKHTYALRTSDGKTVWRFNAGRFVPGIATDRMYYMSLNGLLIAYRAENSPRVEKQR